MYFFGIKGKWNCSEIWKIYFRIFLMNWSRLSESLRAAGKMLLLSFNQLNILLRYVSIFLYTNSRFLNRGKKRFFKHFGRWSKFFQKFCKARHYFHFKSPVKIFGATLTSMFYNLWISILLPRLHLNKIGF